MSNFDDRQPDVEGIPRTDVCELCGRELPPCYAAYGTDKLYRVRYGDRRDIDPRFEL